VYLCNGINITNKIQFTNFIKETGMKKNFFLLRLLFVGLFWSLISTSMTAGISDVCGNCHRVSESC
jgi:hypothetical protein